MANKVTTADFVRRATEKHGGRYDYSKSVYTKTLDKIEIICPVHGSFWQQAGQHMLGQTCASCYHDSMRKSPEDFIAEAQAVHGDRYNYSLIEYKGYRGRVAIYCEQHGVFQQRVDKHLQGHGCPKCVSTMTSSVSQ